MLNHAELLKELITQLVEMLDVFRCRKDDHILEGKESPLSLFNQTPHSPRATLFFDVGVSLDMFGVNLGLV